MKDARGIEVKIGDRVVYVRGNNRRRNSSRLATGIVAKIYENDKECSVYRHGVADIHVYAYRIMKLPIE